MKFDSGGNNEKVSGAVIAGEAESADRDGACSLQTFRAINSVPLSAFRIVICEGRKMPAARTSKRTKVPSLTAKTLTYLFLSGIEGSYRYLR